MRWLNEFTDFARPLQHNNGLCFLTWCSTSNVVLNWVSDLSRRVVQRDRALELV